MNWSPSDCSTNQCPKCDHPIEMNVSTFLGDTSCTACGCQLWYMSIPNARRFFPREHSESLRQAACQFIGSELNVDPDKVINNPNLLSDNDVDSLELLQMVMELEDEIGIA